MPSPGLYRLMIACRACVGQEGKRRVYAFSGRKGLSRIERVERRLMKTVGSPVVLVLSLVLWVRVQSLVLGIEVDTGFEYSLAESDEALLLSILE